MAQAAFDESSEKKEAVPIYGYLASFNLSTIKSLYDWTTGAAQELSEKTPALEKQEPSEQQNIQSSIRKVTQAYQNYTASSQTVVMARQQIEGDIPEEVLNAALSALKAAQVEEINKGKVFIEAYDNLKEIASKHRQKISKEPDEYLSHSDAYDGIRSTMYEAFKAQGVNKEKVDTALHDCRCSGMPENWL